MPNGFFYNYKYKNGYKKLNNMPKTCATCQFNDNGYCQKFDDNMVGETLTCSEYVEKCHCQEVFKEIHNHKNNMFKETFEGATQFCEACERESRLGGLSIGHTCGKEFIKIRKKDMKWKGKIKIKPYYGEGIKEKSEEFEKNINDILDKIKPLVIKDKIADGGSVEVKKPSWEEEIEKLRLAKGYLGLRKIKELIRQTIKEEREQAIKEFKETYPGHVCLDIKKEREQAVREERERILKALPEPYMGNKINDRHSFWNDCLKEVKKILK